MTPEEMDHILIVHEIAEFDTEDRMLFPHEILSFLRLREWMGLSVPEVLLNGDHAKIAEWRLERMIERTRERRPDLL